MKTSTQQLVIRASELKKRKAAERAAPTGYKYIPKAPFCGQVGAGTNVANFRPRENEYIPTFAPEGENEEDIRVVQASGSSLEDHGIKDGDFLTYTKRFPPTPMKGRAYIVENLATGEGFAKKIIPHGPHTFRLKASGGGVPDMMIAKENLRIEGLILGHWHAWEIGDTR